MPRTLDRELADAWLTVLEAYSPEDASRMEAAFEHLTVGDEEEWAEQMIELLAEHDVEVDKL